MMFYASMFLTLGFFGVVVYFQGKSGQSGGARKSPETK